MTILIKAFINYLDLIYYGKTMDSNLYSALRLECLKLAVENSKLFPNSAPLELADIFLNYIQIPYIPLPNDLSENHTQPDLFNESMN